MITARADDSTRGSASLAGSSKYRSSGALGCMSGVSTSSARRTIFCASSKTMTACPWQL